MKTNPEEMPWPLDLECPLCGSNGKMSQGEINQFIDDRKRLKKAKEAAKQLLHLYDTGRSVGAYWDAMQLLREVLGED